MKSFHLDSSSDSQEEIVKPKDRKVPMNMESHILNNQMTLLGEHKKRSTSRHQAKNKESVEEAIYNVD